MIVRRDKMWEAVQAWRNYLLKKDVLQQTMLNMNQWSAKYENDNLPLSTLAIDIDDMKVCKKSKFSGPNLLDRLR